MRGAEISQGTPGSRSGKISGDVVQSWRARGRRRGSSSAGAQLWVRPRRRVHSKTGRPLTRTPGHFAYAPTPSSPPARPPRVGSNRLARAPPRIVTLRSPGFLLGSSPSPRGSGQWRSRRPPRRPPRGGRGRCGKPKPKRRPTGYDGVPGGNGTALSWRSAAASRGRPPDRVPVRHPAEGALPRNPWRAISLGSLVVLRGVLPKSDVDRIVALLCVDIPLELAGSVPARVLSAGAFARWPSADRWTAGAHGSSSTSSAEKPRGRSGGEGEVFRHSPEGSATRATDRRPRRPRPDLGGLGGRARRLVAFSRRWCRLRVVAAPGSVDLASLLGACANLRGALAYCRGRTSGWRWRRPVRTMSGTSNRLNDDKTRMFRRPRANLSVTRST